MADGPLTGFRILDLSSVVSGPFATMLLGDLGADVIKVESPSGDSMRTEGQPRKNDMTVPFLNFNRSKRSVVIDVRKDAGRDLVRRLAIRSDAMIENMRPGVAERLGVGYSEIRKVNPKIVYCSIAGFGPNGAMANAPAYDPIIQGYSGMAHLQRSAEGKPTAVRTAFADKVSGMTAALAIVSALHAARARGVGQQIRIPMLEAMIAFIFNDTATGYTLQPDSEYKAWSQQKATLDPFKTADGWVVIGIFTDDQFLRTAQAAGHPEWWDQNLVRSERRRNVLRGLGRTMPEQSTAHWLAALREHDVPCGPAHTYESLVEDPEILANQVFSVYEYPEVGGVRAPRPGARFSETPMKMGRIPPRLGEHTEEVLREAGFERSQLEELRKAGVIN